jgi:hypothetical protein
MTLSQYNSNKENGDADHFIDKHVIRIFLFALMALCVSLMIMSGIAGF